MSFVFTVSSFCTSAPEEREEKPRNRAFGYVAKSDALSRQRRRRLPVAVPSRKKPSRRAPKKSTWGFSERDDTRLRAQMRTEANRRGRGAEKRAGAEKRGPRKGAGASRQKVRREAIGRLAGGERKTSRSGSRARFSGISRAPSKWSSPAATPPGRHPPPDMCARSGQLRCTIAPASSMQGCPSCKKTRGRLRGRKPNPLNLSVSAGVGSISGSIWGARLCWRPIFMPCSADGAGP